MLICPRLLSVRSVVVICLAMAAASTGPAAQIRPVERTDQNSRTAHAQLLEKARKGGIDIYFEGDSITRRWGALDYPQMLANWRENFFGWNAADFGWGGDTVQNILWRLENGELDDVHPKVIVLLAGTNNIGSRPSAGPDDPRIAEVTAGVDAILKACRAKAPHATIILTGIFPRNDNPGNPTAVMPVIDEINENLARMADGKRIRYISINSELADSSGVLHQGLTVDKLHLSRQGYQIWADALKPVFTELLGPPAHEDHAPPPTGDPRAAAARNAGDRAAKYVVDQAAPDASDTNPGTEDRPFKTVQRAADVARPGDIIHVMAGKYDERIKVKAGGTEGKPVAFVARPRRSVTIGGFDLDADYVRVEGFEITADEPATAVQLRASHCEVLDNYIHGMMAAVSGTVGKPSADGNTRDYSAVAHNRVAYNKVYHCEYGFILGGDDWLVENNEVNRLFMYIAGNRNDDCDYSRFFGKGCVQRYNYYHGSTRDETKTAHVDCLQTFTVNGEIAMDLLFEYNTCFDFHQMCMVESTPHLGSVRNWTFRHNIVSPNAPTLRGGWGPDIIQTPDVTIENCTISTVAWAAIGLRGKESTSGLIRNNILCDAERAVDDRMDFTPADPIVEYNLTFKTAPLEGATNINGRDPLFIDSANRNFRLRQGSPAIGAGKDGVTIGALDYPNVYYVDPRHPAASDEPAWGYPAVPLTSLAKACEIARPGETIVLRGGVYREVLAPKNDGVTVRVLEGEKAAISGADLIEGWQRQADGSWSAPLAAGPRRILRDGRPWSEFRYDEAARRIVVNAGGDPRLHVFETVVRERGIDLAGRENTKIDGIAVVDTLKVDAADPS